MKYAWVSFASIPTLKSSNRFLNVVLASTARFVTRVMTSGTRMNGNSEPAIVFAWTKISLTGIVDLPVADVTDNFSAIFEAYLVVFLDEVGRL